MTTAVAHSRRMLVALTEAQHRGPTDTWTAARDRAAKAAGIERSYAARIWNRWQDMKDVSGEALTRLSVAYVALCEANEARERRQIAEGERIALEKAHEIASATTHSSGRERLGSQAASAAAAAPASLR